MYCAGRAVKTKPRSETPMVGYIQTLSTIQVHSVHVDHWCVLSIVSLPASPDMQSIMAGVKKETGSQWPRGLRHRSTAARLLR
jgi:hypothetical protein